MRGNSARIILGLLLLCGPAVHAQVLDTSVTVRVRVRKTPSGRATITTSLTSLKPDTVVLRDTVRFTRVDTVRVGIPASCPDSLMGPYVDTEYPSYSMDQTVYNACGKFLGRIITSDGLAWTAIAWHSAYPAKRFTSNRQALLYLVGRNTEQPLP